MSANELIERLREPVEDGVPIPVCHLMDEAADLLASQAAEIERLSLNAIHSCHDQCTRPLCVLRRENESLREAFNALLGSCGARGTYHARKYMEAVENAEALLALKGTGADHG